jgi:hypothetical protein
MPDRSRTCFQVIQAILAPLGPMNDDALFFALRRRAFELAETGRYRHWA